METSHFKVLVVEDNPGDAYLIAEACNASTPTCHLTVVRDVSAGWHALSSEVFDLVILDMGLPMENGFHLLLRIRAETRFDDMPVVVFSDLYGAEPARAERFGADRVIPKPGDLATYLGVLSDAVNTFADRAKVRRRSLLERHVDMAATV